LHGRQATQAVADVRQGQLPQSPPREGEGSKRTIRWLNEWLAANGHDVERLWDNVADIVNKTVLACLPTANATGSVLTLLRSR
jgi:hypothetical protein